MRNNIRGERLWRFAIVLILGIGIVMLPKMNARAQASEVVLAWNSSNDSRIDGYRVYYGTSYSNLNYRISVVSATSCVISGLEEGKTYYFVATAFSNAGYESELSNMVSKYIPSIDSCGYAMPTGATADADVQDLPLAEFMYSDDAFGDTTNGKYAHGLYERGVLKVELGGVDSSDILTGISGGWTGDFNVPKSGLVTIEVTYRLVAKEYDDDECGQALVAVNGAAVGCDGEGYIAEICGQGDSGWRQASLSLYLTKGWHTISVGGHNNQKTSLLESAEVFFEKIEVIQ